MSVGARFPFHFLPPSPCLPSLPSRPPLLPLSLLPPLSSSCLSASTFACPSSLPLVYYPLNPARGPRESCKLPQRVARPPNALWCIFRLKLAQLFHFHNDTFVIFTVPFGCVQRRRNKIPVAATLGHRPHNLLAVESVPMHNASPEITLISSVGTKSNKGRKVDAKTKAETIYETSKMHCYSLTKAHYKQEKIPLKQNKYSSHTRYGVMYAKYCLFHRDLQLTFEPKI